MKKLLLTSILAIIFAAGNLFAAGTDLFSYDKDELNNEFAELNSLENYVKTNQGVTLTNLLEENNPLVANLSLRAPFSFPLPFEEPPLGIGSFWWGCLFGILGILLVYVVTEDNDEVKQALKGCVVGTLVSVVLYFGLYIGLLGASGFF